MITPVHSAKSSAHPSGSRAYFWTSLIGKPARMNLLLTLTTATLVAGCRKPKETALAEAPPVAERPASVSVEQATADAAPPPPPSQENPDAATSGPPAPEENTAPAAPRTALDLESLNTILDNYVAAYDRVPKSVDEMVRLKLIPRQPTPSAGKKYVVDVVRRQIREENR